jgi:hypothetical protein
VSFSVRAVFRLRVARGGVLGGGTGRTSVPASSIIKNKQTNSLVPINPTPCLAVWSISGLVVFGGSLQQHPQRIIPVFAVKVAIIFNDLCFNALG